MPVEVIKSNKLEDFTPVTVESDEELIIDWEMPLDGKAKIKRIVTRKKIK